MNIFDDFDLILAHFNKKEEPLFLRDIKEFAEKNKEVVIQSFSTLLKNKSLNIQLKYLILKSIGELKYIEFVPLVKDTLHLETRIQIIHEAVSSLTAIGTFSCYKVIVDFLIKHKKAEFAEKVRNGTFKFSLNRMGPNGTKNSEKNGKEVQIDLLLDRADGVIYVCEIKHYNKKFAIDKTYAQQLKSKLETFKKKAKTTKQLFFTMITTEGVTQNEYKVDLVSKEVTLKDLFGKD
jgi:hypothetical protein